MSADVHPETPKGRYFVVRGRLWRRSNPALGGEERERLVGELPAARRAVGLGRRRGDAKSVAEARRAVDAAKLALGERGPVWWRDGAPDFNRRLVGRTPYANWFAGLACDEGGEPSASGVRASRPIREEGSTG